MIVASAVREQNIVNIGNGDLVIVIEDDPRLSSALEVLVRCWGYCCLVARTPREALVASAGRMHDVCAVIIDIEIDALNRADRSARLFAEATGRDVPVLLTTTDAGALAPEQHVSVLAKPFDPELVRIWLGANATTQAPAAVRAQA